jgi:hydrogenase maturation protease
MADDLRILLLAYGNPGRRDDGLGPALAGALEDLRLPGVTVDVDYQLTVEHAAAVAGHDVVIFVDADTAAAEPFSFRRIPPPADLDGESGAGPGWTFSTHSLQPDGVLSLAAELFQARPTAYVLGIRGYDFDAFGEDLSERARTNLEAATEFIRTVVEQRRFPEAEACSIGRRGARPVAAAVLKSPSKGALS